MKKFYSFLSTALLCLCLSSLTSCLKESDKMNTMVLNGTFTITGTYPSYTLIGDNGNSVQLTPESVSELTGNKGFGDYKRIQAVCTYEDKDITQTADGRYSIVNATLSTAWYITVGKIYDTDAATAENILAPDSLFEVSLLDQAWIYNGYMTTSIYGPYSAINGQAIAPGINLMVKPDGIKTNEVSFRILYNRHSSKTGSAGARYFVNSFDVSTVSIPGSDSVNVKLEVDGIDPVSFKVARGNFLKKY